MRITFLRRYFLPVLVATLLAGVVTSCDDDGPPPPPPGGGGWDLTGTWQADMGGGDIYRYTFYPDGTGYGQWIYPPRAASFINDYYVQNGYLYIYWAGEGGYELEGAISIGGGGFSLQYNPGEPWYNFYGV